MSEKPAHATPLHRDPQHRHIARNARYGLWLFGLYVIFYAGFVLLSAFRPQVMTRGVGGVNLAIVYGMGLIVLAFVLALVYMFITRTRADDHAHAAAASSSGEGRA